MDEAYLPCEFKLGLFPQERIVKLRIEDKEYQMLADEEDVLSQEQATTSEWSQGRLRVYVVEKNGDTVLVNLPGETLASGRRLSVPPSALGA